MTPTMIETRRSSIQVARQEAPPGKAVDTEPGREILPMVVDRSTMKPVDLRRTALVARGSEGA